MAKYLKNLPPCPKWPPRPKPGVAKYIKNLPKPAVVATGETGVTKYLKSLNG
ncbi:hypothetical protein N4J17_05230 [Methylococcus capsulatus]|uniref:Uncharacterized protein n=1 Tax=Methylococcus capsulatus TaxID=414 RepID=A0ABZ2F6Y5_METCP